MLNGHRQINQMPPDASSQSPTRMLSRTCASMHVLFPLMKFMIISMFLSRQMLEGVRVRKSWLQYQHPQQFNRVAMYSVTVWALLLIVSLVSHVLSENVNSTKSCAVLYEEGVRAYLDNNFAECVARFEEAIEKYKLYRKSVQNCRIKCADEAELSDSLYNVDIEDLRFYEKTIKKTLCIIKCKSDKNIFGKYNLNDEAQSLFENRKPYEYLHICYFQVSNLKVNTCNI